MRTLIFDFDGTIADSLPTMLEKIRHHTNRPMPGLGEVRSSTVKELFKTYDVRMSELPPLVIKIYGEFKANMASIPMIEGLKEVLEDLKAGGFNMHIVSSNSAENVKAYLAHHGVTAFATVVGRAGIFGKGQSIRKLIKRLGVDPAGCVYVGDEARDVEAARAAKAASLAVTWGYNTEEVLAREMPDFVAREPQDLLQILGVRERAAQRSGQRIAIDVAKA